MVGNFDLEEPNDGNENVGKKSKDVQEGGFLRKLRLRIVFLFLLFITFATLFSVFLMFVIMQSNSNLQLVFANGEVFMGTFSNNIVMMIAVKEKILDLSNYNSYFKANI